MRSVLTFWGTEETIGSGNVWRDTLRSNLRSTLELGTMFTSYLWIIKHIRQIPLTSAVRRKQTLGTKTFQLIESGTLLSVMWQPGWEGSLGENRYMYMYPYMYMYGWVPSLFTCNYHNIICWSIVPQYKIQSF